jgi:hypothetical protein
MNSNILVKKILILTANPKGTARLRLDEEVREIESGLERSHKRDQFVIKSRWAVRPIDFRRAMLDVEPQIVHFSGHGAGDGGLEFEDEKGQVKFVDAEGLAGLFELFTKQVECVVLNACYSEIQAKAIARHVNYVIGMSQAIGDRAAITFTVAFYDALGAGRCVEFAYKLGCNAIRLENIPENLTPKLLTKDHLRTEHSNTTETSTEDLSSDRGIDYTRLRDLLAAGKWKEADGETEMLILEAAGRKGNLLNVQSIQRFPARDLRTIDQLWVKSSQGHFGFSVQKQIWEHLRKTTDNEYELYCSFGNCVGWRKHGSWLWYKDMTFDICAPKGHLPQWGLEAVLLGKMVQWQFNEFRMSQGLGEPVFSKFFDRVQTCNF